VPKIQRIVRACSNPGDTVLDPFSGSGSTAEAAALEGRSFIAIEQDTGYHQLAMERLAQI